MFWVGKFVIFKFKVYIVLGFEIRDVVYIVIICIMMVSDEIKW